MTPHSLPHASERLPVWKGAWERSGKLVLLLDFDGTLAPIVSRPEDAAPLPESSAALRRLRAFPSVVIAVVSGRGMADARDRVGLPDIAYAGNHGMEIEGSGLHRIHREAAEARPHLLAVAQILEAELGGIQGVQVEDKKLTLSIHYRRVDRAFVEAVRVAVFRAVEAHPSLLITEGKEILEVRPMVEWDKGKAVEFLLGEFDLPPGAPVLYLGDDRTDEDAFRALSRHAGIQGEGVVVGDPPPEDTAATAYLRAPDEVATLLRALADSAPD